MLRHPFAVTAVSFAPDGVAVGAADAVGVSLWDAREGRELLRMPGRASVRFLRDASPDEVAGRLR